MKPATISQLKKTLDPLPREELLDACLRLARFKVDNKELLTYLFLKADDEAAYVDEVCAEIDESLPHAKSVLKKTLRKIIRTLDKRIRHSGNKETELQVRIHFCREIVDRKIRFGQCRVSANMYLTQIKKIEKGLGKVHPDLQFDFRVQLTGLDEYVS